eukprot:c32820_g1_i1 orf=8-184(-)
MVRGGSSRFPSIEVTFQTLELKVLGMMFLDIEAYKYLLLSNSQGIQGLPHRKCISVAV